MAASDSGHRAARLAAALCIACVTGALVHFCTTDEIMQRNIKTATGTAGIIIVVAQTPLLGGLPRSAFENLFGTLIGAALGVVFFFVWDRVVPDEYQVDYYLRLLTSPVVGGFGLCLGNALGMEGAGKLIPMTYLLVVVNNVEEKLALLYASARFLGILFGVLCNQIATILVFQKSAHEDIVSKVREALDELTQLNRHVWSCRQLATPHALSDLARVSEAPGLTCDPPAKPAALNLRINSLALGSATTAELNEDKLEQHQLRVHFSLNGALGSLALTFNECLLWGKTPGNWFFLPMILCSAGWHISRLHVNKAVIAMRRVARLEYNLWMLLNNLPDDLADESTENAATIIGIIRDFRFLTQAALDAMLAAYTRNAVAAPDSLYYLAQKVGSIQNLAFLNRPGPGPGSIHPDGTDSVKDTRSSKAAKGPKPSGASAAEGLKEPLMAESEEVEEDEEMMLPGRRQLNQLSAQLNNAPWNSMTVEVWWHNYQFVMVRLADGLCSLHNCLGVLMQSVNPQN